ncbi:zinc finger protein 34-like [Sitodiplosis mosellana]|uniref:zinc finger protein 34-like n=1 Tax=Sitodiplosis mosellana TaxID=263140 RepID=UPI002443D69D|nr:zinc finger protein 34-like [Sitodiplosis mosellana]
MTMLSCPLCCQSCFSSVDLLHASLISVLNRPLMCPICNDIQHSIADLATHLTQHIEIPSQIGHSVPARDANIVIQNININNETTASESKQSGVNQFDATEQRIISDGNVTQKLDATSPVLLSVHDVEQPSINNSNHIDRIIRPPYVCNLCNCSFRTQELQQMHMQLVHEINIRPSSEDSELANAHVISPTMLQCYLCPKRFKMIGSLRLHVRMVHGVSHASPQKICTTPDAHEMENNNLVQSTGNNENETRTGDLIPSASSTTTTTAAATHVNSTNLPLVHNNQCDYYSNYGRSDVVTFGCGGSGNGSSKQKDIGSPTTNGNNNSKEMIVVVSSTEDRVHKCDFCNKRFTTKYFLKKHKRLHTGEMPYTCELCHRTFTFQQSYHRHLSYHTNDRPHSCSICGRAFKELSTLHNHQRIHSGEKPFECETCGKCFRQRVSYLVHRRIHTGVMPYNCTMCDKKFRYKISLRTHKCSGFVVNELTASARNNNDATFMDNDDDDQPNNMSACSPSLDELISESCNRMGIVDQIESNPSESTASLYANNSENGINPNQSSLSSPSSMLHFECDSFNLNDLGFCTGETGASTDLANVMPSMNEIFPQTMEILNALYDNVNNVNNGDLQQFYDTTTTTASPQQPQ